MSASLVGSEMCIRDRWLAGCGGGARALLAPRPAAARGLLRAPRPGLLAAVSYTHLTLPTICSV
eukprot:14839133-Alexandrium_andersonii.AAC.1